MDSTATSLLTVLLPASRRVRRRPRIIPAVPRLSVVVVNYLQWQDTATLVRQLRQTPALRHGAAEVIIVDNDSPWHTLIPRLRRMPGVSLRRWRSGQSQNGEIGISRTKKSKKSGARPIGTSTSCTTSSHAPRPRSRLRIARSGS